MRFLNGLTNTTDERGIHFTIATKIVVSTSVTIASAKLSSANLGPCRKGIEATKFFENDRWLGSEPVTVDATRTVLIGFPSTLGQEALTLLSRPSALDLTLRRADGVTDCVRVDLVGRSEKVEWELIKATWRSGVNWRVLSGYRLPFSGAFTFSVPVERNVGPVRLATELGFGVYRGPGGMLTGAVETQVTLADTQRLSLDAALGYEAWLVLPPDSPPAGSVVPSQRLFMHGPRGILKFTLPIDSVEGSAFAMDPHPGAIGLELPVGWMYGSESSHHRTTAIVAGVALSLRFSL